MVWREEQVVADCARLAPRGDLRLGPGDDAAVLADGTVVTVDAVVEGVHFEPGTPLDDVVGKALGSALSDVCAMGARAEAVVVACQLPPGTDGAALAAALGTWARRFDVALAGGDTVAAPPGALALAVTAIGRLDGQAPWTRAGARPGDVLAVSGPLGGARAGRHLRVRPRRDVVAALRSRGAEVHAAMDLSDGLGLDLRRLCAASGVGAEVEAERLPIHGDVGPGRDRILAALGDGEDFELLLALPPHDDLSPGLLAIGRIVAGAGPALLRAGRAEAWPAVGFEHGG